MKTIDINTVIARWTSPGARPLFKGSLIDDSGCCCAQGDILRHECKMSNTDLRNIEQSAADARIAELLGISLFHAVLLRVVNDRQDGCPQDVLLDPEKVIGDQWHRLLSFGWHIHRMTPEQWSTAGAAARDAAWAAAGEIMGAKILREQGKPFFFLPMFGSATPEDIPLVDVFQLQHTAP